MELHIRDVAKTYRNGVQALKDVTEQFGPYPFSHLTVVERGSHGDALSTEARRSITAKRPRCSWIIRRPEYEGAAWMIELSFTNLRFVVAILVLSSCIGCDRATKALATHALRDAPPRSYLDGTIQLVYTLNPGGFLGLGGNLPASWRAWIFIGANSCLVLALSTYLVARSNIRMPMFIATLCILAGGIGNLIDRAANHGLVTDFVHLGIGPLRTGIFNVADVALTLGALCAVLFNWDVRGNAAAKK